MRPRHIALAAAILLAAFPCMGQKRPTKRQLLQQNEELTRQLDSMRALLQDYEERLRVDDSLHGEVLELFSENEDKAGAAQEEYTAATTDSLLNIWYLHRSNNLEDVASYNMDSVHFSSNVPDSVYIKRIERMNSYITVPYNEKVRNYMILYSEKMPTKMQYMLGLSNYYWPIFEEILSKYDMPQELKYMAIIESALNPTATSRVGARGMWQFMYKAARAYGLKINSFVDERLDPVKSADAAARYMRDAYRIFGDWNLAISSYNCGPGNVNKAIKRSGSRAFWDLYEYLPRETRGYVPAFVGAMYAFTYYKEHGLTPAAVELPSIVDTFQIRKMLHFKQINEVVGVPLQTIRDLNPQYVHDIIPGDEDYILRLPYQYTAAFIENEDSVYTYKASELFNPTVIQNIKDAGSEEASRVVYKVKSGDYLGRIASRYHVSVSDIKKWNHLRNNNLRIGQKLVIYNRGYNPPAQKTSSSSEPKSTVSDKTPTAGTYTVKEGDTLYDIAKKYPGVSAQDIMKHNGLKSASIRPGMKLKIPSVS
ncbi:MAG: LysM peptidoglycan-binding domain-containing protein [Bacteroidales bacterium]|nr:LysM peptidoglycan-binding domain-containing protein [Bacteroidales bacterium]